MLLLQIFLISESPYKFILVTKLTKTLLKKKIIEIMSFTNNTKNKPSAAIATQLDTYYETTVSGYIKQIRLIQTSADLQAIHQLILELLSSYYNHKSGQEYCQQPVPDTYNIHIQNKGECLEQFKDFFVDGNINVDPSPTKLQSMPSAMKSSNNEPSSTKMTQGNTYTERTVSGYMRQMGLVQRSVYLQAIPQLILELCLLYYNHKRGREFFQKSILDNKGKKIHANNNGSQASIPQEFGEELKDYFVNGNINIDKSQRDFVYEWDIKINQESPIIYGLGIGISDSFHDDSCATYYRLCQDGFAYFQERLEPDKKDKEFNKYHDQDLLTVRFNVQRETLEFEINNYSEGVVFDHIPLDHGESYHLSICFCGDDLMYGDLGIELINFKEKEREKK